MNTPKWIKFIGDRNVKTVKEAENYIKEKALPQFEKVGYGNNVIVRKKDKIKLGTAGIYHREGKDEPDIGFAFLPNFERMGYAYEAATKIMVSAKYDHGLQVLSAYTLEENKASKKLLERLGFQLKGIGRLPNNDEELLHYHCTLDKI
jgi:RimJ/RimL family protein N-acetyltransferase